jgi:hypothetical protein
VGRHSKGQAQAHPTRIVLDRRFDKLLDARKVHNLVELGDDLVATHAQDCAIEKDILAACQLVVKTRANL